MQLYKKMFNDPQSMYKFKGFFENDIVVLSPTFSKFYYIHKLCVF